MERSQKEEFLFELLTTISNKLDTFSLNCLDELTLKQFFLIQYIYYIQDICKEKGKPYIKEIANISGTIRQNVKGMVNILNKKGYLTLEHSEVDNRAICVSLTQKSLDFIQNNSDGSLEFLGQMFENSNDTDLDSIIKVLLSPMNFFGG